MSDYEGARGFAANVTEIEGVRIDEGLLERVREAKVSETLREQLAEVVALAPSMPEPSELSVRLLLHRLQGRGLSCAAGEAELLVREMMAAEWYGRK